MPISAIDFKQEYIDIINWYTDKLGILGGFILSFVENIFPPLPIFAIVIANVGAFGPILGFLVSFMGHFLGAYVVFVFVRYVVKPRVHKHIKQDSKLYRFENWIGRRSFVTLLIVLSLPFVPYFFVNIASAFSSIRKRVYILALFVGNFLMVAFLVVVGVTFNNAISDGNYYALAYPLILVLIAFIIGKILEKKFDLK